MAVWKDRDAFGIAFSSSIAKSTVGALGCYSMRRLIPLVLSECNVAAECEDNWFEWTSVDVFNRSEVHHTWYSLARQGVAVR